MELVEYDLRHWSDEQRESLGWWLQTSAIPGEWREDGVLVVPHAMRDRVDDLVAFLELPPAPSGPHASAGPRAPEPASPWRRLAASLIDGLAVSVLAFALLAGFGQDSTAAWGVELVGAAYVIVPTAIWGKTPGKLACLITVTRVDGTAPPGWSTSVVRWVVPALSVPLDVVFGTIWFGVVWSIAVYAPILGPARRGLHDRVAGTIVVRDPE